MKKNIGGRAAGLVAFAFWLTVVAVVSSAQDDAERIRVITSGGFSASFDLLGPLFEEATGIEVVTEYGSSMGGAPDSIPMRLARGETKDVLIFNRQAFEELAATG